MSWGDLGASDDGCIFEERRRTMQLTKKILYDLIVQRISENTLGYVFWKNNTRDYYFRRQSPYPKAEDTMTVTAYLRKGYLNCYQESIILKPLSYGLINRRRPLYNSAPWELTLYGKYEFNFEYTVDSLELALDQFLIDLNIAGRDFVMYSDARYKHPKFVKGMAFIESLTMSVAEVEAMLSAVRGWHGRNHENDPEPFRTLLNLFDEIDQYDDSDPDMKSQWGNTHFVQDVFKKYIADVREKENPGRRS